MRCSNRHMFCIYVASHYITLHHITSHYITSHYITLHHITFRPLSLTPCHPYCELRFHLLDAALPVGRTPSQRLCVLLRICSDCTTPQLCATGSRVGGSGFFNLALEPSHLRHSARVLTTSHVPTHNTCATKHSRLSHSLRVIRIASCAFTFWMLRCLLVALRRSGCACCYGSVPTIVVRLELAIVSHVIGDNFAAVCGGRSRLGYSVLPIGFCWILESVVWCPAPLDVFGSSARSVLNDVAVLEGSPVRLWSETQRQVLDVAIGHTILEPCCG